MNEIQAHINNIAFPKTIDELLFFIYEHGCFNVEDILYDAQNPGFTEWTVPKWCKYGDIVLFMHSKTANATISKLRTALLHNETLFEPNVYNHLLSSISRGKQLYNKYGGKIFAMGTIGGPPCYEPSTSDDFHSVLHWKSRIYAIVDHLFCLDVPIDISEFHDFIHISRQSAITPIYGDSYERLKRLIMAKNHTPDYFNNSISTPLPLTSITRNNWLNISKYYRHSFFLEIQFRTYYVNYLLEFLGDIKSFYQECPCIKYNTHRFFVDNVIRLNKKFMPVEVKLTISSERDLLSQLAQYCMTDYIILNESHHQKVYPEQIYNQFVLVIDTNSIYLYNHQQYSIQEIMPLDSITTANDILYLRKIILDIIGDIPKNTLPK